MEQRTIFDLIEEDEKRELNSDFCENIAEWQPKKRILLITNTINDEYPHVLRVLSYGTETRKEKYKLLTDMGKRIVEIINDYGKYNKKKLLKSISIDGSLYDAYVLEEK